MGEFAEHVEREVVRALTRLKPISAHLCREGESCANRPEPDRYLGAALEELTPVLGLLSSNLKTCDVFARRIPGGLHRQIETAHRDYEELIPYLHDYGIEDTAPLEGIRDELAGWLRQQGRGKGPSPASM